jgi:hypothetical protein
MGLIVVLMGLNLPAEYLDVGSDPGKIKVDAIQEIDVIGDYGFYDFSPNGEYFAFSSDNEDDTNYKTIIFKKDAIIFKEINYQFMLWPLDNSENIVVLDRYNKFWIYNIITNNKLKIEIDKKEFDIYCFNKKKDILIYNDNNKIYEYNIDTKISQLIHTASNESVPADSIILTSNDMLYYIQYTLDGHTHLNPLFQFNLKTKFLKKVLNGFVLPVIPFSIRPGKTIIVCDKEEYIYFLDENGNIIHKLKSYHMESLPGNPDKIYHQGFYIFSSALAPNGKLFAISSVVYSEVDDEEIQYSDIYILNLKGKKINMTKTIDKIEFVLHWSPLGDKLIYFNNTLNKFYIMKIKKIQ